MPVVLRAYGLRFVIFVDHHPPHVHVFGDGAAKIAIGQDGAPPVMVSQQDTSRAVQRRALRAVRGHQAELLLQWTEHHG